MEPELGKCGIVTIETNSDDTISKEIPENFGEAFRIVLG